MEEKKKVYTKHIAARLKFGFVNCWEREGSRKRIEAKFFKEDEKFEKQERRSTSDE